MAAAVAASSSSSLLPSSVDKSPRAVLPTGQQQYSPSFLSTSHLPPSSSSSSCTSLRSSCFRKHNERKRRAFYVSSNLREYREPLKVMISGAPASGKGTQCELIVKNHGLVHISAGDLLRAEIAAGSENGIKAKDYMTRGQLVPNEIIVEMVKNRLNQSDAQQKGWLLDGYPRSRSQAEAIEAVGIRPDVFIVLEVPENVLIERVVGRRLDPVTGRIYHIEYSPPETKEIEERLTQRFDDTEHQAKLRLQTHSQNVDAVLSIYSDITQVVDGNRPKDEVYDEIDSVLLNLKKCHHVVASTALS